MQHLEISFRNFPRTQFAWNVTAYFLGKIKRNIINLLSAEIAWRPWSAGHVDVQTDQGIRCPLNPFNPCHAE